MDRVPVVVKTDDSGVAWDSRNDAGTRRARRGSARMPVDTPSPRIAALRERLIGWYLAPLAFLVRCACLALERWAPIPPGEEDLRR